MRITEIWRATIPGHTSHVVLADPATESLFVSDGWGVAYAALRLHRLDPETGETLAEARTRQQHVSALATSDESLFVATHSRLLRVNPSDLAVIEHWDRALPSDAQQLVACGQWLVAANRRKPVVGLFDRAGGRSVRLRVGLQPLLFRQGGTVIVAEGFDGGMRALDFEQARLLGAETGPPLAAVAAGAEVWGVEAGEATGGAASGAPSAWSKPGTDRLVRLGDADHRWLALLPGPGEEVFCDDEQGVVWCLIGPRGSELVAVSQEERRLVASFRAGPGRYWAYFDPVSGLALAAEAVDGEDGYRTSQAVSALVAYRIVAA